MLKTFDMDSQAAAGLVDAALRARARRVIPGGLWGHQNAARLPAGYPQFFARGEGCRLWDVDGHEYIDFICAVIDGALNFIELCFRHIVAERKAGHSHQKNFFLSDLSAGSFHPKRWDTNANETELPGLLYQLIDVACSQRSLVELHAELLHPDGSDVNHAVCVPGGARPPS